VKPKKYNKLVNITKKRTRLTDIENTLLVTRKMSKGKGGNPGVRDQEV